MASSVSLHLIVIFSFYCKEKLLLLIEVGICQIHAGESESAKFKIIPDIIRFPNN